jgi:hypothetical protein
VLKVAIRPFIMEYIPVKVESYSGYKSDEYPIRFYRDNNKYEILEIIDRWYQSDSSPEWPISNYFKIATLSGSQYILKHDLKSDEWYLGM